MPGACGKPQLARPMDHDCNSSAFIPGPGRRIARPGGAAATHLGPAAIYLGAGWGLRDRIRR